MAEVRDAKETPFPSGSLPGFAAGAEVFAREAFDRLINHRRFGLVRELYSPAAHWSGPGGRRLFGWGEIAGWYTALIGSFGDARLVVDHVASIEASDAHDVAVRWRFAGTHDGPALYGAPSGREIFVLAVTHWRIVDGRIVDEVTVFDEVALMRQMEGGL